MVQRGTACAAVAAAMAEAEMARLVAPVRAAWCAALLQSAASTPTHKDELNKLADGALLTPKGVKNAMTPTCAPSCNAACRGLCMLPP